MTRVPFGVVAALAAILTVVLGGCAAPWQPVKDDRSAGVPSASFSPTAPAPLDIVVYGDSNTTGFAGTLEAGAAAGLAWVAHLPSEEYSWSGGWAVDGATTADMASAATPMPGADLLIVMGGTNDIARGVPLDTVIANILHIAEVVDAPRVAVAAIAPLNVLPGEALALNEALETFAREQAWAFVDPWRDLRHRDGTWIEGYSPDGVHASPEGYAQAAAQIALQLRSAVP